MLEPLAEGGVDLLALEQASMRFGSAFEITVPRGAKCRPRA